MGEQARTSGLALSERPRRRNYQACLECKKHKVKCRLGDSENPRPPCVRCRRSLLSCTFGPARKLRSRTSPRGGSLHNDHLDSEAILLAPQPPFTTISDEATCSTPNCSEVSHMAVDTNLSGVTRASENASSTSSWSDFDLCRAGQLRSCDADHLLRYFFQWMHPIYPIVDDKYSNPTHWGQMILKEPLLCTTILVIASRYTWYQSDKSSSKAFEAHNALYRHLELRIQSYLWMSGQSYRSAVNSLGLIESIILLVEWHPRSMDLEVSSHGIAGNISLEIYGYDDGSRQKDLNSKPTLEAKACHSLDRFKPFNVVSWRLLCMAVSVADEIGIHQVFTVGKDRNHDNETRNAHVQEFLACLFWERSYRLGRKSLINHTFVTYEPAQSETPTNTLRQLLQCRSELYRLTRLIENRLYASLHHSEDRAITTECQWSIQVFSGLLDAWKTQFDLLESTMPLSKHLRMMWHNTRLFLFSIGLKTAVTRWKAFEVWESSVEGSSNHSTSDQSQPTVLPDQLPKDHDMIKDMVSDANQMIQLAIDMHNQGILRHVPMNMIYHIASASLVLLRVHNMPLNKPLNSISTLAQLIGVLHESSVDDVQASSVLASLLKDMLVSSNSTQNGDIIPALFPNSVLNKKEEPNEALELNASSVESSSGMKITAHSGLDLPLQLLGSSTQEALLAFDFDEDWLGWMNI